MNKRVGDRPPYQKNENYKQSAGQFQGRGDSGFGQGQRFRRFDREEDREALNNYKRFEENCQEFPDHIFIVDDDKPYKYYVYQLKEKLKKNDCPILEVHAQDKYGIRSLSIVIEMLTNFGYADIVKIKTKHGLLGPVRAVRRGVKIIVQICRSAKFDDLYNEYETERAARFPSHQPRPTHNRPPQSQTAQGENQQSPIQKGEEQETKEKIEEKELQEEEDEGDETYKPEEGTEEREDEEKDFDSALEYDGGQTQEEGKEQTHPHPKDQVPDEQSKQADPK